MKFAKLHESINQDARGEINLSILQRIENNKITKREAFQQYTAKGGLHNLQFNQFGSFHDYTSAKKEIENGQFFTPIEVVEKITRVVNPVGSVLDPCCGSGRFFNFVDERDCTGIELDPEVYRVAKFCFPSANIERYNANYWDSKGKKFDYILTNPPFNIKWGEIMSQSYILRSSKIWLKNYGVFAAVVPVKFLQDQMYHKQDVTFIERNFNWLGQIELPNDTFKNEYGINFETKVIFFQNCEGEPFNESFQSWEQVERIIESAQLERRRNLVSVAQSEVKRNDYSFKESTRYKNGGFKFQVRKILFEIKAHKGGKVLSKALALLDQLKSQEKPHGVDHKEWMKIALTEAKVLSRLRLMIGKSKKKRTKKESPAPCSIETTLFSKVRPHLKDIDFSNKFTFKNASGEWSLNDIQKEDCAKLITKKYSILNAEQGTGKTAMSFCVSERRNTRLTIVLAPALAVATTWADHLNQNGKTFQVIKKRSDVRFDVDYWLISFTGLSLGHKFPKFIKRQLRRISNNVQVVVDESDEMSNRNSKRYKAARTALSKAKYKLLTTGTTTRNKASEIYPQLEFLYCNSSNLTDNCETSYQEEKGRGIETKINGRENSNFGKPFGGYHGLSQFKSCFSPESTSVLGIKKQGQDFYNYDELRKVIDQSCIIRTFKEVVGDKYKIKHLSIQPTLDERQLQETILEEFYKIVYNYYNNTGSSRKESALRIIRQLQLLIKSCSMPQTFEEYLGRGCSKMSRITKLVKDNNEKIIIGCVTLDAVRAYYGEIQSKFFRPTYIITGSTSFKKRKAILKQFESTINGVLVCTQQSLKSSVNVPSCNIVVCESMQWNLPKMSQFYFRCIRFNSKENTDVYFVTYKDSIEDNLLSLLMSKERINRSLKLDEKEMSEVFEEYGFDLDTLDRLMVKEIEKDSDGNIRTRIRWGKQLKVS